MISSDAETAFPSTAVISSPCRSPARSAGPSCTTAAISTPGPVWPYWPKPKAAACALVSSTPRNAVGPTWTVDDELPDSICVASVSAVSIGIA